MEGLKMADIQVRTSELRGKASELRALNNQFKSAVTNLENVEGRLNGMWDGEANDTFHAAFQTDKAQMENFYQAIEDYAAKMEAIADEYDRAEAANTQIAS